MERVKLEELISAYIDDELAPPLKAKVEVLVRDNAQARDIMDGYLSVRTAFERSGSSSISRAPSDMLSRVRAAIEAKSPRPSKSPSLQYDAIPGVSHFVNRLKNPRIYAYPLAVLICAILIGIFHRSPTPTGETTPIARNNPIHETPVLTEDSTPENTPDISPRTPTISPKNTIIPAPLSADAGAAKRSEETVSAKERVILCKVENMATVMKIFPQTFAKYDVSWTQSTSGATNMVVFDVTVTPEILKSILEDFTARKIQWTEETRSEENTSDAVKVRFQIESR